MGRQGVPLINLDAVSTCDEHGWQIGDTLTCSNWKYPRVILEVSGKFVKLQSQIVAKRERVRSFPPDIKKVKDV